MKWARLSIFDSKNLSSHVMKWSQRKKNISKAKLICVNIVWFIFLSDWNDALRWTPKFTLTNYSSCKMCEFNNVLCEHKFYSCSKSSESIGCVITNMKNSRVSCKSHKNLLFSLQMQNYLIPSFYLKFFTIINANWVKAQNINSRQN